MANDLTNPIEGYTESWENHTGAEVEAWVKGRLQGHESDIAGLREKVDAAAQATKQVVSLLRDGGGQVVTLDNTATVRLRFTSISLTPNGTPTPTKAPTNEDGMLTIESRTDQTKPWTVRGAATIDSVSDDSTAWTEVDLAKYLPNGVHYVRLHVRGNGSQLATGYVALQVSKINLSLSFRNAWQTPIRGAVMPLNFCFDGAVAKTLHVEVSGPQGWRKVSYPLGTSVSADAPRCYELQDTDADTVKVMTHGIHEVRAWLSLDGRTPVTKVIKAQVMVVADRADAKPYIIVNNAVDTFDTWSQTRMFDYAVYTPDGSSVPVRFVLADPNTGAVLLDLNDAAVPSGEVRTMANVVETDETAQQIPGVMTITSGGAKIGPEVRFTINNPEGFAPVRGADFVLNPKLRTNSEANPATIINANGGTAVAAEFNGFGFIADGWTTDDAGARCLRIPAGRRITIDYPLLQDFTGDSTVAKTSSLCLDLDFAVRAITDESAPIVRACSYTADGKPLGLQLSALEGGLLTNGKVEALDQYAGWEELRRTHLTMTLTYNAGSTGHNLCRMYVNGVINKEFAYDDKDVFVSGADVPKLILGGSGADLDIYSLRVYRKELSMRDVEQNHTAVLPGVADKLAFRAANAIILDGAINYELASAKLNTIKWVGRYPRYGDTKKTKTPGTLVINQVGKPDYSGTVTGLEIAPQGTSAMTYHDMNFQVAFKDGAGGTWTDGNGVARGAYIQMGEGMPKAVKNCGKVNYASSMQSHKLGACMLFNDLYKVILGSSTIMQTPGYEACRVAVNQVPFLLFEQSDENAEPRFIGLVTFGPAKGDKPTFGFDSAKFPDHVAIEGADNDVPVVMGRTPWLDADVTLTGGDWLYNNAKQFSLMEGDETKVQPLKDAFNFVYQTYYNIDYHIGDLASLRAARNLDTDKHYWLTAAGESNAQFDLCRYDYKSKTWVHAGMTKNGEGDYSAMNINTQCGNIAEGVDWTAVNAAFRAKRLEMFKEGVGSHFDLQSLLFLMSYLLLVGASDNWCKNTYWFVDPTTKKIGPYQDDLDTIFLLNNTGKLRKPYDVEEHDRDASGANLWNAERNGLFNAMQLAYGQELRDMMHTMLTQMERLGGSLEGCVDKYFYAVQKYFPACAYNETARIFYERAYADKATGAYTNGTDPLTQSNGSSLERERQWMTKRLAYLSSYAAYGEFSCRDGGRSAGSLNFRSIKRRNGTRCNYRVTVTPRISMYPTFGVGQNVRRGTADDLPRRIRAGESFTAELGEADGNTNMFINGIDHMYSVGNLADVALDVLGAQKKLTAIDLRGTSLTFVTVPATEELRTLHLPATLTELVLEAQPNLTEVTVQGVGRLETLKLGANVPGARDIVERAALGDAPLRSVALPSVSWTNVKATTVKYLAKKKSQLGDAFRIAGTVKVASGQTLTLADMQQLWSVFGSAEAADPSTSLVVDYSACYVPLRDFRISNRNDYFESPGEYRLAPMLTPANANMIKSVSWSLDNDTCGTIAPATGVLSVTRVDGDLKPTATVSCSITMLDGTTMTRSLLLHFFAKEPMKIGDVVYHDGSYGTELVDGKVPVGVCCEISTKPDGTLLREIVSVSNAGYAQWGPTSDLRDSTNTVVMPVNVKFIPDLPSATVSWNDARDEWNLPTRDTATFEVYAKAIRGGEDLAITGPTYRHTTSYDADVPGAEPGAVEQTPADTLMPVAQYYTRRIIAERNKLMRIFGKTIPAAQFGFTELEDYTSRVQADGYYNLQGYGAFSRSYAYEPVLNDAAKRQEMADEIKVHNWYLPALGTVQRMAVILKMAQAGHARFAHIKTMMDAGVIAPMSEQTWSAAENPDNANGALCVSPSGSVSGNFKYHTYAVRPAAAF